VTQMSDGSYPAPKGTRFLKPESIEVGYDVHDERRSQNAKWGEQDHPNGTDGRDQNVHNANTAKWLTDAHAKAGTVTWRDILDEEVQEAFAEFDPRKLRTELIQVAAVAQAWVEAIDRRDDS